MSMDFECFCFNVQLVKLMAVVLLTWIGAGSCSCSRNFSVCHKRIASFTLSKVAVISVSAVEDITFLRMVLIVCIAPFGFAYSELFILSDRKKNPLALLLPFNIERYEPSLWTFRIIPL